MSLAEISIKRPIFITSCVLLSVATGLLAMTKIGVDLFPDVTLPVVLVTTPYPGAGPAEIETLVTKPIEDEVSTISGVKRLSSENREGFSIVTVEFNLEVDVKYAEQQVRDHVGTAKAKLPTDVKDSTIQRLDPADQPIIAFSLNADLPPAQLYDLADNQIKPLIEQVDNVGKVDILGGRKREIHIDLDRTKLANFELSASQIAARLSGTGQNVPGGKKDLGPKQISFRTLGEFNNLQDLGHMVVNFFSNEVPVRIDQVGVVTDTLEDEGTRTFVNGQSTLTMNAYKQSGSNTVQVSDDLKKRIVKINKLFESQPGHPKLTLVRDGAVAIRINVEDVEESIVIGIVLAVLVVFLFLANFRSTIITGLALPNSLIGAFVLMWIAGYTINIMTLLALTLSVGLLVDDAIVVRENIFRHIEMGKSAIRAALDGTAEVQLAVIATTLTVVSVFGPLAFLSGVVGQFFKQFGLTVVFAMLISLFDALTIAPMLSAYFAGHQHKEQSKLYFYTFGWFLTGFSRFQDWLENVYEKLLRRVTIHPLLTIFVSVVICASLFYLAKFVPKTFLPPSDAGEFTVALDLPPGTSLDAMSETALKIDQVLRKNKEVKLTQLTVGSTTGDSNQASFYVALTPGKTRKASTTDVKVRVREQLKEFKYANPIIGDVGLVGGQRMFNVNILGTDQAVLEKLGLELEEKLKAEPSLVDVDVNFRPGKPEFQVRPAKDKLERFGVSAAGIGGEIRAQIEGLTPAKFRENGLEYDIRVRMQEDQRDLQKSFHQTMIPNINNRLIRLESIALPLPTTGPAVITRQDRMKYVQVNGDIAAGKGLGDAMTNTAKLFESGTIKLPAGYSYKFIGQSEDFQDLGVSVAIAMGAAVLFILLVLSSLYESFVTPFTIMLAMPLAICGAFAGLAIAHESINIFSMIGLVMLLGVAVKNSILLVDYAHQKIAEGIDRTEAIIMAGRTRLRPILMTSMALVAGTLPIAMGLNEASKQRVSMGAAIIGGLVSSTLLTLIVIPAAFSYVDRFRVWAKNTLGGWFIEDFKDEENAVKKNES